MQRGRSIVSLVCNVQRSSEVLEKVFRRLKVVSPLSFPSPFNGNRFTCQGPVEFEADLELLTGCGLLQDMGVNVHMISQGASKTNIALVMCSKVAADAIKALHLEFYGETKGSGKYSSISK